MNINKIALFSIACFGCSPLASSTEQDLSNIDHTLGVIFQNSNIQDQADINRCAVGGRFLPDYFEPLFRLENAVDTLNHIINEFNLRYGTDKVWYLDEGTRVKVVNTVDKTTDLFELIRVCRAYVHNPDGDKDRLKEIYLYTGQSTAAQENLESLIEYLSVASGRQYSISEESCSAEQQSITSELSLIQNAITATGNCCNRLVVSSEEDGEIYNVFSEIHKLFFKWQPTDSSALKLFELTDKDEGDTVGYKLSPAIDISLVEALRKEKNELQTQLHTLLDILTHIAYKVH
ncbi:MAG: hypothetical protein LBD36_02150 [Holosporales bacterium]|nr:hypothetical protein [Holosporales bacterium]